MYSRKQLLIYHSIESKLAMQMSQSDKDDLGVDQDLISQNNVCYKQSEELVAVTID